jgi:hypothetical protein
MLLLQLFLQLQNSVLTRKKKLSCYQEKNMLQKVHN